MKKLFFIALACFLFVTTHSAFAGGGEKESGAELIAAGRINKQPLYQLRLNNEQTTRFYILVKDAFGEILHEEWATGKNITRTYQLNTTELGNTAVVFEVYNTLGWLTGSFRVNANRGTETAVLHR